MVEELERRHMVVTDIPDLPDAGAPMPSVDTAPQLAFVDTAPQPASVDTAPQPPADTETEPSEAGSESSGENFQMWV